MRFENGAIVHQFWGEEAASLVATFQYVTDADAFCQMPRDKGGPAYIRTCMYSGEMRVFPAEPVIEQKDQPHD